MAKLSTRPVSSFFLMMKGMVTVRLVSIRGSQNASDTATRVKGTGRSG